MIIKKTEMAIIPNVILNRFFYRVTKSIPNIKPDKITKKEAIL